MTNEPDLSAFLLAHAGFRTEFGRLAAVLPAPRDAAHAALIEQQVELVLACLHHHHTDEDTTLWPRLRERFPRALPLLDVLEEQHETVDADVAVLADRTRPAADRAHAAARLHTALGRHLDDEERDAVPLLLRAYTAQEWLEHGRQVVGGYDRRLLPALFGWLCSAGTPELAARALAEFPWPVRLVFRLRWWPAYRRRHHALYGTHVRAHAGRAS
ncbi:hemerythrin domain-containing protein [Dactylosporangium aurantiacum]|uniref:Hemerythrin domain-containing protein n=1 Tax=Dactylosporangium aurantiacum TaxID=35754 RepID=A0A9Q9MMR5_9ACTN|nr:hemerythrin domain-containing protein [Dactylosporangium aurantiacum]MDG6109137.1 hemerythrin domain-containing protein [Dactylosporangium aurantiacum]UWZ58466.1 hemerythrin domain-containing protein [Dactylosporangium aurantiacum]